MTNTLTTPLSAQELPPLPRPLIARGDFPAFQSNIAMNCYSAVQMDERWREGFRSGLAALGAAGEVKAGEQAQPIGHAGAMPGTSGFTMACFKACDVPMGTPLYLCPVGHERALALEELAQQLEDNHIISGSPGPLFSAGWSSAMKACAKKLRALAGQGAAQP